MPRTIAVETASCINVDTNIILHLPKEARAFITSKFRGQEIHEICRKKNRLWIEILNTSYSEDFKIKKKTALGFLLIIQPENLNLNMRRKESHKNKRAYQETGGKRWKTY